MNITSAAKQFPRTLPSQRKPVPKAKTESIGDSVTLSDTTPPTLGTAKTIGASLFFGGLAAVPLINGFVLEATVPCAASTFAEAGEKLAGKKGLVLGAAAGVVGPVGMTILATMAVAKESWHPAVRIGCVAANSLFSGGIVAHSLSRS